MSKLSKIFVLVLSIVLCMGLMATAVSATETTGSDGLKVTLITDKQEYTALEQIKVTMKVENTSGAAMSNVVATLTAPQSLHIMGGEQILQLETLEAGAAKTADVTYQAPINPATGDNSKIVLIFAAAIVSALAIACLAWNRKTAAMVLALVMVMALAAPVVNAAEVEAKAEVAVKVDGQKIVLTATAKAEVEEPAEPTYVKISENTQDDWTGTYLVVVDQDVSKIWNPALLGNAGNDIDVAIEDGKIVGDYAAYAIKIAKFGDAGKYSVQLPNGKYLSAVGNLLGMSMSESGAPAAITVSGMANGFLTVGGTQVLTWNNGKFTLAKASLGGFGTQPVGVKTYLYKLQEDAQPVEPPVDPPVDPVDPPVLPTTGTYAKTTSAADWSGTYLVVAEGVSKVWDPNKLDAVDGNGSDIEIKDGKITGDYSALTIKITKAPTAGKYYIQVANGKYLSKVSAGLGFALALSDTPYEWNVVETAVGYLNASVDKLYLSWVETTNLFTGKPITRFQFASTSSQNATMTYLYKLQEN